LVSPVVTNPAGASETPATLAPNEPTLIANRYQVLALLGRGGMAAAYRVRDRQLGSELALKRLTVEGDATRAIELFEREYHTLVQLAHPRVVRVFDYGVEGAHPYYTMELLDGGDQKDLGPLPWQQACLVAYEVCSALSLLHSRGLVHRDLTPRNIRRSASGQAKLIDFGLLAPMGPAGAIAGTPPFVAPELLSQTSLDGRSDLFSLGATLYFALTGRLAFPARRIDQLRDLWRSPPKPPSQLAADIPEALDTLVMSLLRIDASSRPKSAAEVMDRLRPLLAQAPEEDLSVASAYLAAPKLIGRSEELTRLRKLVIRCTRARGGGFTISGASGTGRTRMLDAFVLEAKLLGGAIARVDPTAAATGAFGAARAIVTQLHAAAPLESLTVARSDADIREVLFGSADVVGEGFLHALLDIDRPGLDHTKVHSALRNWVQGISRQRFVAIAVDDIGLVDGPSAALVASLALGAAEHRFAYAVVASESELAEPSSAALASLGQHATRIELQPFAAAQTAELLRGVFGDAPNLHALSTRLHEVAEGRPRETMALAQHLVDVRALSYEGGTWKLPATLDSSLLPTNLADAFEQRVRALSSDATLIARVLAVSAVRAVSRAHLLALEGMSTARLDAAIDALRRTRLIAGTPAGYTLGNRNAAALLIEHAEPGAIAQLHDRLAALFERSEVPALAVAFHRLQGTNPDAGLDYLLSNVQTSQNPTQLIYAGFAQLGGALTGRTLELAHERAKTAQRPLVQRIPLWSMLAGVAAAGEDPRYYRQVPGDWLAILKQESGFHDWHALVHVTDPATRAMQAFGMAANRYQATPEHERGRPPADAIRHMVSYVVFAIAIGNRTADLALINSLPALLEPFVTLSPMVSAMRANAESASMQAAGRREAARDKCVELIKRLDEMQGPDLPFVDKIRAALCQAVAKLELALGIETDAFTRWSWASEPSQVVGAECLRKVAALHRGDWEAAEQHRRRADVIRLENSVGAMYTNLGEELEAHARADDLTGVRGMRESIAATAARLPGWRGLQYVADAEYHRLCGEPDKALAIVAEARQYNAGQTCESRFILEALAVEVEVLLTLGRPQQALDAGLQALALCTERGRSDLARQISGSVALAEATLGQCAQARMRMQEVLDAQRALGVRGLLLGRSFELLARIAIVEGDQQAYAAAAAKTAEQYRPGHNSLLSVLYERLVEEARRTGLLAAASGGDVATEAEGSALLSHVETVMVLCTDQPSRAQAALALLCNDTVQQPGALFLLTDSGLMLSAATTSFPVEARLMTFAQMQIELELDDGSCTMTAGILSNLGDDDAIAGQVTDVNGVNYRPHVLGCLNEDDYYVVGVALLSTQVESRALLSHVTHAVAKHLIESGDYRPALSA
jgi:hypothetical protein